MIGTDNPRGGRRRGVDPRTMGLGDCTDCTLCVQVCPTGIDIRKCLQYECIACAACIDACNGVMDKMGYPRGLVRYDTQHALDQESTRIVRPRVLVYGALLAALIVGFVATLAMREPLALDVLHDRNTLYRNLDSGEIENVYLLKIMNKAEQPRTFVVSLDDDGDHRLDPARPVFEVGAGEVFNAAVRVRRDAWQDDAEEDDDRQSEVIRLTITALDDRSLRASAESRFFAPRD